MFVHTTILKVNPENVQAAVDVLFGEKLLAFQGQLQGFRHGSLIESLEEPGKLISLSYWDSMADAQSTMSDPRYGELVAGLRSILIAAPERFGYNLLREVSAKDLQTA
jgi:heme-degrading monooxygenase HmoA